jgi:hypothetical protein
MAVVINEFEVVAAPVPVPSAPATPSSPPAIVIAPSPALRNEFERQSRFVAERAARCRTY